MEQLQLASGQAAVELAATLKEVFVPEEGRPFVMSLGVGEEKVTDLCVQ